MESKNQFWCVQRSCCCRLLSVAILTVSLMGASGCQSLAWFRPPTPAAPAIFKSMPGSAEVIAAIERNTERVSQLNCSVKVVMDGMPASASGTLLVERPDRMRLRVGVLGMTDSGIDIGSNERQFWIFNKSTFGGSQPTVYFANHLDYESSPLQQALQLRPQWFIEAMGLVSFDPSERIEGPFEEQGNLVMFATRVSPQGITTRRVYTIHPQSGVVLQQAVYDGNDRLIGWARSSKHRYYPEFRVSLPEHIELNGIGADGQAMKLSVHLQSHKINSLYVDPNLTWTMPQPADIPLVDLSRIDPSNFQQPVPTAPRGERASQSMPDRRRTPFRFGRLKGFDLRR